MPRTAVRRTAVAASMLSLALTLGACATDESGAKSESKSESKGETAGAKALSAAELGKLALTKKDAPGHRFTEVSAADVKEASAVKLKKAECEPLIEAMTFRPGGKASAATTQTLVPMANAPKPDKDASPEEQAKAAMSMFSGTTTSITLASFEGEGAAEGFAALEKSVEDCSGGFSIDAEGQNTEFTKVEKFDHTAGDESFGVTLVLSAGPKETLTVNLVTVRKGGVLASFNALSLQGKTEKPKALVDAQLKKLG
ncbi:hypothetical protein [Streptomyces jumonjinensis]|uniref:Sensor domain-containing protein n=1 Tax=Streptomyces jumonjinensis TaxID=1945 RepID=A0A646KDD4_STRJU|nr:hypothetical protein [Streptomyces jumonjinensis]MQT00130.1 hypothetical protein [Streptomyces jumonjinensis]